MLRAVDIQPPDYKDPVTMLRNIASEIENGDHGVVSTLVVVTFGDEGLEMFGGGKDSDVFHCSYILGAAHSQLLAIP